MDRNRRERTSPATNNRMFHPTSATSFPCVRVAHPPADKIRFARYRSTGFAAAQIECLGCRVSRSPTFLLRRFEIVDARTARGQSQLSVWVVGIRPLKLPKFPKILIGAAWAGRLSLIAQQFLREIERKATTLRRKK